MVERISRKRRVQLQNVAEREIQKYAGNHAAWHKHVHNVELDAAQILKMKEMDMHRNTVDFSSRRTGKTVVKELYLLEDNACNADQELGIVSPREAQSIVNLDYHLDAIRRSEILKAFIAHKNGRYQMSDTRYEFVNRSKAQGYGIMAQVDGGDLTAASLEEVDDMPKERLYSRFLLMLGSTRRLGANQASKNDPQIRITGVFKGADTLTELIDTGTYHCLGAFHGNRAREEIKRMIDAGWLSEDAVEMGTYRFPVPIMNAVIAMEMGLLNKEFITGLMGDLSEDEFIRQLLCINTSSHNLVWEIYLRRALQVGLEADLQLASPVVGQTYKKRGLLSFGYDHSGHGEQPESSKYALVVLEKIGSFDVPIFARTWPPGTDEKIVREDLLFYWRYFNPDEAMGDAFGIGLITELNERLFHEGLTTIDRNAIGDGESTASTWGEWAFSPIRFEGMTKHQMAQAVRSSYHSMHAALPYLDDYDLTNPETIDYRLLLRQIINIVPEVSKAAYSSYKMAKKKLGDDLFDAYMAAQWALITRGAGQIKTIVHTQKRTREQLLGERPMRLPSEPYAA